MDVILSALLGSITSYFTSKDVTASIKPWSDKVTDMCFHPANNDPQGNLRVVYSGLSSIVDRSLCIFVNFFQNCSHDVLGSPILALLLAAFGTAMMIMAMEGSRQGFKRTPLSLFPIFGFVANCVGIYLIFPLVWVPLAIYYKRGALFKKDQWNITLPKVYGTFVAYYIGYGLPTVFLFSPYVKPDTKLEQDVWALWQFCPLLIAPLIPVFVKFFQQPSPIDRISDEEERNRLYIAEGKDAVEKSYLLLGIINMLVYFGAYLVVAHQGIHIWDSLVLLYRAPSNLPSSISFGDLGQILTTRTSMMDFAVLSLSFIIWAIFDGGLVSALSVVLAMPIIGPSAAISFYAYYRESFVQNLASTNPAFEKDVNKVPTKDKKRTAPHS